MPPKKVEQSTFTLPKFRSFVYFLSESNRIGNIDFSVKYVTIYIVVTCCYDINPRGVPVQSNDSTQGTTSTGVTKKHGFANMSPVRQREIASRGGKAAHEKGTAHKFTSETGRIAAKKRGGIKKQDV